VKTNQAVAQQNIKRKKTAFLIILGLILFYIALIYFNHYLATIILREFKRRVEVHLIYGSTPGKALLFPLIVLVSLALSLVIPKINKNFSNIVWVD